MASHEDYMAHCIKLAKRAGNQTRTNPLVGAILVYQDKIIGEGFHEVYGQAHAERNAINQALQKYPNLVQDSTLYITLEPCCHKGKTPPCVDFIIANKIKTVIVGSIDPNPIVSSKSIKLLQENNVKVIQNILSFECEYLISKFKANLEKRPHIILKWAQSKDGFIGQKDKQLWISNEYSKILVHKWRSEIEGIMVGTQTAIQDNPSLTTREWNGNNPIRIVPDLNNRIPFDSKLLNDGNQTLILSKRQLNSGPNVKYLQIEDSDIKTYWKALYDQGIYSILVEGGRKLLNEIIRSGLWDEARVITSEKKINEGIKAPFVNGKLYNKMTLSDDQILTILNDRS